VRLVVECYAEEANWKHIIYALASILVTIFTAFRDILGGDIVAKHQGY